MTTWGFTGYEKMPEQPEKWGLGEAGQRALSKARWVVTEKIHGANFCLATDGVEVRAAKRKQWLDEDDAFFGHRPLLARLTPRLLALHARLGRTGLVFVYGELFGGAYPHPAVAPVPGVQPVQTGIWYAPGIEFCAFDLASEGPEGRQYASYERATQLFAEVGLLYAEPLVVARYEEAMAFPLGFDSHMPARLGLPPLPGPNRAEGVVIKPFDELLVRDERGRPLRPVIKKKLPEFAEDERFHQAERWEQAPSTLFEALKQHASWLVNEPRLAAARSKLGPVEQQGDRGRRALAEAIVEDVLVSLAEEWGPQLDALGQGERARLEEFLLGEASALVELVLASM